MRKLSLFYKNIIGCTKLINSEKIKKIIGFSLVELMISLITISCIAAAFAPVISKRLSNQSTGVGSSNNLLPDCTAKFHKECKLCNPNECVVCDLGCVEGKYVDIPKCECANCATGCRQCYAENGTTKCTECQAGYSYSNGTCSKCTDSTKVKVCLSNGKWCNMPKYVCYGGTRAQELAIYPYSTGCSGNTITCSGTPCYCN